jgi:hypothetical protein
MAQDEPTMRAERPDENPYAPPRTETAPAVIEKKTDEVGNLRTKHLRRESCIRVAGLIGLNVAGFVVLTFGIGAISELYRQKDDSFEP